MTWSSSAPERIVIVGAGQAGAWVARSIRAAGSSASILLIGEEKHPPYERPPLSKQVLMGKGTGGVELLGSEEMERLDIAFLPDRTVVSLDRATKVVIDMDGNRLPYDTLVLATGGRPRPSSIPGADVPGILTLRNLGDAVTIGERLRTGARLLVIGGGWIGLEVAAAARTHGAHVQLLEAGARLCARAVPPLISEYLLALHQRHGVVVELNKTVEEFRSGPGESVDARIGGSWNRYDVVIFGIGLVPNDDIARAAGLAVENGIVVDQFGQSSDPSIYAVGDVANQPHHSTDKRVRYESWANAQNQAIAVGTTIAGRPTPYRQVPWFWSDQFDINLQVLGEPDVEARLIMRGEIQSGSFCLFELEESKIRSVIAVNAARDLKLAKRLMVARTMVEPAWLCDESVRLDRMVESGAAVFGH